MKRMFDAATAAGAGSGAASSSASASNGAAASPPPEPADLDMPVTEGTSDAVMGKYAGTASLSKRFGKALLRGLGGKRQKHTNKMCLCFFVFLPVGGKANTAYSARQRPSLDDKLGSEHSNDSSKDDDGTLPGRFY